MTTNRVNQWITRNLRQSEVDCKCGKCEGGSLRFEVAELFQKIRVAVDGPVVVGSAIRCLHHNRSIGSKDTSRHVEGLALDLYTPAGYNLNTFYQLCDKLMGHKGGLGRYESWNSGGGGLHVDCRKKRARWVG